MSYSVQLWLELLLSTCILWIKNQNYVHLTDFHGTPMSRITYAPHNDEFRVNERQKHAYWKIYYTSRVTNAGFGSRTETWIVLYRLNGVITLTVLLCQRWTAIQIKYRSRDARIIAVTTSAAVREALLYRASSFV